MPTPDAAIITHRQVRARYFKTPEQRARYDQQIRDIKEGAVARFARQHPRTPDGRFKKAQP